MVKRRTFLKAGTAAATGTFLLGEVRAAKRQDYSWDPDEPLKSVGLQITEALEILKKGERNNVVPVLREEILENPDAVFIINAGITNERDEKGDWKPLVFIMTDGMPTDNWQSAADQINRIKQRRGIDSIIACAAGPEADSSVLKQITEIVFELAGLQPNDLAVFYKWVSDDSAVDDVE